MIVNVELSAAIWLLKVRVRDLYHKIFLKSPFITIHCLNRHLLVMKSQKEYKPSRLSAYPIFVPILDWFVTRPPQQNDDLGMVRVWKTTFH